MRGQKDYQAFQSFGQDNTVGGGEESQVTIITQKQN